MTEQMPQLDIANIIGAVEPVLVSGVCLNSRTIRAGDAFVALEGLNGHGGVYAGQAAADGAAVVLIDADDTAAQALFAEQELAIPVLKVPELRSKLGALARAVYGSVDQQVSLVGITGTDGKTSISHFVAQLLQLLNVPCAVLGTVGNGFLGELSESTHTTGDVFNVYQKIADFADRGASTVAMEVSSHALHQARVAGLQFKAAVLSNLGSDHLDYHGTVENYADAKALLFDQRAQYCVLNMDDAFGQRLLDARPDAISYSVGNHRAATWFAEHCEFNADGMGFDLVVDGQKHAVQLPVLGAFNVANILAACAVVHALGNNTQQIIDCLPRLHAVVGRAELLSNSAEEKSTSAKVVIDYAHTAQALSAILNTLRAHFSGRILCVFGCGGDRDKSKRPEMAKAAEVGADQLVLTSDNPRSEDPHTIVQDMLLGIDCANDVIVELDRAKAIATALRLAESGDCVLIAGKGHEDYQILSDTTVAFSDHDEVRKWQEECA